MQSEFKGQKMHSQKDVTGERKQEANLKLEITVSNSWSYFASIKMHCKHCRFISKVDVTQIIRLTTHAPPPCI